MADSLPPPPVPPDAQPLKQPVHASWWKVIRDACDLEPRQCRYPFCGCPDFRAWEGQTAGEALSEFDRRVDLDAKETV
jgi:hypothetical protein